MDEWKTVISSDTLRYIQIFEKVTRVRAKDCFEENNLMFYVVDKGNLGQAIGKESHRLRKLEEILKKKVKIVEFDQKEKFIKNLFKPFVLTSLEIRDETRGNVAYVSVEPKDKGKAIGEKGKNLHLIKKFANKYYKIENVIVI